jgi:non-canonical purine NTP pyrophosphatase (RdgB/HAM1 family)
MDVFRTTPRWIIASHNPGKIREIGELLTPRGIAAAGAGELGVPEPEETEDSFSGNALLKARACAAATGEVSLADDSGLAVTALNGAPGIHSARWAGEPRDFGRAMQRVHGELEAAAAQDVGASRCSLEDHGVEEVALADAGVPHEFPAEPGKELRTMLLVVVRCRVESRADCCLGVCGGDRSSPRLTVARTD